MKITANGVTIPGDLTEGLLIHILSEDGDVLGPVRIVASGRPLVIKGNERHHSAIRLDHTKIDKHPWEPAIIVEQHGVNDQISEAAPNVVAWNQQLADTVEHGGTLPHQARKDPAS